MWEIWAILMLPKALKSCPKSNKLPNLVTLIVAHWFQKGTRFLLSQNKDRFFFKAFYCYSTSKPNSEQVLNLSASVLLAQI